MPNRTDTSYEWQLIPKNITVTMDRPLFKGPKPLSGREQVVASSAGGWKISYQDIPIYGSGNYNYANNTGSRIQLYRQAMNICIGNGLPALISPVIGPLSLKNRYNLGSTSPTNCSLSASATRGATSITFTNSPTSPLRFGDYFELNGRLHVITTITGSVATIWPPLRANYSSGQLLEIADPRCLCYIETDSQANSITFEMGRIASWNVDFIEASW